MRLLSSHLARLPRCGPRVALVAVFLVAILAFGAFSFAPAAHAAGVASSGPNTAVVEIVTQRAHSVLVKKLSSPLQLPKCYNTPPGHVTTIRGLEGEVEFTGYSNSTCSRTPLCRAILSIPPGGHIFIRFC